MSTPEPPAAPADDGETIPTLTEVVELSGYDTVELPESLSEIDWPALEARIRDNLIGRLLQRSDPLIEQEMRGALRAVVDRAVEAIASELNDALASVVRDVVNRAVSDELTRVQAEIARRRGTT
ncbi:MAG: hypothetical protein JSW68_06745 [Burkholderiales bacterium]|nr:MAG: hypothetical protein JSW68_06745 [Burkholderiales bacterium]